MQPDGSVIEICHVVRDMDKAIETWTGLFGAGPFFVFEAPNMPGQTHWGAPTDAALKIGFGFSGNLLIEFVEPLDDAPSVFRDVLDERGEGFHHVMMRLGYDEGRARMEAAGYPLGYAGTMPTGERFGLWDARADTGGFIEFMDMTPNSFGPIEKIHAAHIAWDGQTAPKRSLEDLFA